MPVISSYSRYRPQASAFAPGVISPFEEEISPAFNPRAIEAPPVEPITEQRVDAPRVGTPEAMPSPVAKPIMPPPGMPEPPPVEAPKIAPAVAKVPLPAPPVDVPLPPLEAQAPVVGGMPKARNVDLGDRPPSDADTQLKAATDKLSQVQQARPAAPKSNVGQRIATAILAMSRFAPATDLLVHPKWSEQERQYNRDLASAKGGFDTAKGALETESLAAKRDADIAGKYAQVAQRDVALEQADSIREQRALDAESHAKAIKDEQKRKFVLAQLDGLDNQYGLQSETPPGWKFIPDEDSPGKGWIVEPAMRELPPELAKYAPGYKPGEQISSKAFKAATAAFTTALASQDKRDDRVPTSVVEWEAILNDPKESPERKAQAKAVLDAELKRVQAGKPVTNVGVQDHRNFQDESALRKEFQTLPTVKARNEVRTQLNRAETVLEQALKSGSANSADQVLVTSLNKIIDPTSVVREGEYARTAEGQAAFDRLQGIADRIKRGGGGLSNAERQAVMDTIRNISGAIEQQYRPIEDEYRNRAKQYGFDVDRTIATASGMTPPTQSQGGSDMVDVQIPGMPPGKISRSQVDAFKKKYPNAVVK